MKKINSLGILIVLGILLTGSISFALSFKDYDPKGVVFKAGPTGPGEELSIPWVEAVLYPKKVEAGRDFFVEVSLASKVKSVVAELDQYKTVALFSKDQSNWNVVIPSPKDADDGLHFIKVKIEGQNGRRVERTLAFRIVGKSPAQAKAYSFPLSLKEDTRLSRGALKAGAKVEALYRKTYYWVKGKNGSEGWVEASKVEIPKREIFVAAYQSYLNQEYNKAVSFYKQILLVDEKNADASYWLAKTYDRVGDEIKTVEHLEEALASDPRHEGANWMAGKLARQYYRKGNVLTRMKKPKEALLAFQQAVSLRPASISYWLRLGTEYENLGDQEAAQDAWKQVLLVDPDNKDVHALLRTDYYKLISNEEEKVAKKTAARVVKSKPKSPGKNSKMSLQFIDVVKKSRTNKGTIVSSALKSVVSMTKSLGTRIYEEGWKSTLTPQGFLVTYVCKQERLGKIEPENFIFRVDLDSRKVEPRNKNARLLMHRW
ncbi:MAG: hypothetical protein HQ564_08795 [Candidatus Saganbacteria bacterium]|nr:hypothetical protein [Candidatus Saganbacteria bacterium]